MCRISKAFESYRLLEFSHLISCEKITEKQHSSVDFKLPATQYAKSIDELINFKLKGGCQFYTKALFLFCPNIKSDLKEYTMICLSDP